MAKFQLTNKAVEDLANIWDYTFEVWSEEQADKYYNYLFDCFQNLSDNPNWVSHSLLKFLLLNLIFHLFLTLLLVVKQEMATGLICLQKWIIMWVEL
jgi:hypothetical protein